MTEKLVEAANIGKGPMKLSHWHTIIINKPHKFIVDI